jgi:hypothetical protein
VRAPDELVIAQLSLTTFHHFREKERCFALGVTSVAGILFRIVTLPNPRQTSFSRQDVEGAEGNPSNLCSGRGHGLKTQAVPRCSSALDRYVSRCGVRFPHDLPRWLSQLPRTSLHITSRKEQLPHVQLTS